MAKTNPIPKPKKTLSSSVSIDSEISEEMNRAITIEPENKKREQKIPKKEIRKTIKKLRNQKNLLKKSISRKNLEKELRAEELIRLRKKGERLQYDYEQTLTKLEKASLKLKIINDELKSVKEKMEHYKKGKKTE